MNDLLILTRAVHFIATVAATGAVFFAAFVAAPSLRKAGSDGRLAARIWSRVGRVMVAALVVFFLSAVAWLVQTTAEISDRTLAQVFADNVIWRVLAQTGYGHGWLVRLALALLLAAMLLVVPPARQTDGYRMTAAAVAAALVALLAWASHAAGTGGIEGDVHMLGDALHLIAAALWVGMLLPLALLLHAARGDQDTAALAVAQIAVERFSALGVASVATILLTGLINTWFLAGAVPALVGTDYGRLLLVKVALFLAMVGVAAVNRFVLRPRLVEAQSRDALHGLERNGAIEAILGAIILAIVGVLGTMAPGLHEQPIWPFSFRIPSAVFGQTDFYVAILFGLAWVATGIFIRRFRWPAIAVGLVILVLEAYRLPIVEAYPTTFFGSPTGFSAQSIAEGESLFAASCASCHGAQAHGDGPAAASLKTMPADLTADHVYDHTDGELLWWITHGIPPDMPAFGDGLDEDARWNVIDFIRANADALRLRPLGAGTTAAFPAPDFSAQCPDGSAISIAALRPSVIHVLVAGPGSDDWLRQIADRDKAAKLSTLIVAASPDVAKDTQLCVARDPAILKALALYRGSEPIDGTEFLVDAAGNLRSMWHADEPANAREASALELRVRGLRAAARVQRPASTEGHTHHH